MALPDSRWQLRGHGGLRSRRRSVLASVCGWTFEVAYPFAALRG